MAREGDLVRQAQRGDAQAFGCLYETYADRVFNYLLSRVCDSAIAEDLTAETFVKALQAIHGYRWRDLPFGAWLFRIAHNALVDHWRSSARKNTTSLEESDVLSDQTVDPFNQVVTWQELEWGMAQLTDLQREAVALRFIAGLSIAETAKAIQRSEEAVKDLQHKGLAALRKHLAQSAR